MYHGTGHLNSEPFYEKANPHDLNTELVRYSDPHFILLPFLLIKKLLCNNFNKFSKLNNFVSFYHKNLSQVPTMFLTIWIFFQITGTTFEKISMHLRMLQTLVSCPSLWPGSSSTSLITSSRGLEERPYSLSPWPCRASVQALPVLLLLFCRQVKFP